MDTKPINPTDNPNSKVIFAIIVAVIVTALVVGGGVYVAMKMIYKSQTPAPTKLPAQTQTSVPSPTATPVPPDEIAEWNSYTSDTLRISFKYPPDWSVELIENLSNPSTFKGDRQGIVIARPNQGGKQASNYMNNIYISYRDITESFEKYIQPVFCDVGQCSPVELDLNKEVIIDGKRGVLQVGDLSIAGKQIQSLIQVEDKRILAIYSSVGYAGQNLESLEAKEQIQTFQSILNSIRFLDKVIALKTYQNTQFGFQLKYPGNFTFHSPTDSSLMSQYGYMGKHTKIIGSFAYPENSFPGTNFTQAYATVAVNPVIASLDGCKVYRSGPRGDETSKPLSKTVSMNGITFYYDSITGAAAGTLSETKIYHAFHNEMCYELNFNLFTANINNYPSGTVQEVNESEIWTQLENIIASFGFTN